MPFHFQLDAYTIAFIVVGVVVAVLQLLISRFAKNLLAGFLLPILWIVAAGVLYFYYNWRGLKIYLPLIIGLVVLFLLYAIAREWRSHSEQKRKDKEKREHFETEAELEKEKARREQMEEQLEQLKEQQEEQISRLKEQQEEQSKLLDEKNQQLEEKAQELQDAKAEAAEQSAKADVYSSQN